MHAGEGVQSTVDFIIETSALYSGWFASGKRVGHERGAPFHLNFFEECNLNLFARDRSAAYASIKAQQLRDVVVQDVVEGRNIDGLLHRRETFVVLEGGAEVVACCSHRRRQAGMRGGSQVILKGKMRGRR